MGPKFAHFQMKKSKKMLVFAEKIDQISYFVPNVILKSKILKYHIGMYDKVLFSAVSLCFGIINTKSFDKCKRYLQGSLFKDKNLDVPCSPQKSVPSTHYVLSLDILYVPSSQSLGYFNSDTIFFINQCYSILSLLQIGSFYLPT